MTRTPAARSHRLTEVPGGLCGGELPEKFVGTNSSASVRRCVGYGRGVRVTELPPCD